MSSPRTKFVIAASAVVIAVGGLIVWATGSSPVYYYTPSELKAEPAGLLDRVRVSGKVVEGSININGTTTTFVVADDGSEIRVRTDDVLPDTFAAGVDVVAEGAVVEDGSFTASTVLARCPSKFKARLTES